MAKNTHLEHLEDSILLDGKQGAVDAFMFLDELSRVFSTTSSSAMKITTKWDGAPAVFCGTYPGTNYFFVGTKSIFNKGAKVNFTPEDVDVNHGNSPGLAAKLKDCLKYLPELNIQGVAQGDLLFTDDKVKKKINNQNCIIFQPNTITYCIPEEDELYEKAASAKLGVVFHTEYVGRELHSMNAKFGYNVNNLTKSSNVLVLSAETGELGKDTLLTPEEKKYVSTVTKQQNLVAGSFLNTLAEHNAGKDQLALGTRLKIVFNQYVRQGKKMGNPSNVIKEFKDYYMGVGQKEADKLKTAKGKTGKLAKVYSGLRQVDSHQKDLEKTINLYKNLQSAKEVFIRKLEKGERFGTYLRTENGYKITAPEGYVAITEGDKAVKLVDRLAFSTANFNAEKNWVAGDAKK